MDDSASRAVVEAVASVADEDPLDMDPLYAAIDPDALDAFYQSVQSRPDGRASVTFTYNGHRVHLSNDGDVSVEEIP